MADKRKSLSRLRLFPSFSVKYRGGEDKKRGGVFSRDTGGKQSSSPVLLAVRRRGEQEARQEAWREQERRQGGWREQEGRQGNWREVERRQESLREMEGRQGSWREQERRQGSWREQYRIL